MKHQIATDKNQSTRLLSAGVKPETADMCIGSATGKLYTTICKEDIPAWSLSALLSLLPKEIDIDGYPYRISIYFENEKEPVIGNQWCLYYKPKKHNEKSRIDDVPMYATDLIECAVLMVEWLTRHNYKLNEI